MKGICRWSAAGLAVLLALLPVGCQRQQEEEPRSSAEKAEPYSGQSQLMFEQPAGYRYYQSREEISYLLEDAAGESRAKIVLSGDNQEYAAAELVESAVRSGDYGKLEEALAAILAEGEMQSVQVGGYPGVRLEGRPVEENHRAMEGGDARLVVLSVDQQLVVVEGYCQADYREDFVKEFDAFLKSGRPVAMDEAMAKLQEGQIRQASPVLEEGMPEESERSQSMG